LHSLNGLTYQGAAVEVLSRVGETVK